jgi:hypothetical protein
MSDVMSLTLGGFPAQWKGAYESMHAVLTEVLSHRSTECCRPEVPTHPMGNLRTASLYEYQTWCWQWLMILSSLRPLTNLLPTLFNVEEENLIIANANVRLLVLNDRETPF